MSTCHAYARLYIAPFIAAALSAVVFVLPVSGGQIGAIPFSASSNVGEGIAEFADEILEELMFDSSEDVIGSEEVGEAVNEIRAADADISASALRKKLCADLDLDSILVGSVRKVGKSMHVRIKRYSSGQKMLAQGKSTAATEDELEDALIEATELALGKKKAASSGTASKPKPEEKVTKGYPPSPKGSPVIQIQYVEDDGCRWSAHKKGAKLEYIIVSSDLYPHLKPGDVIVQVDGQLYQSGLFSYVRKKLIDGFAPQADLVVLRNNKPKFFIMERKPNKQIGR